MGSDGIRAGWTQRTLAWWRAQKIQHVGYLVGAFQGAWTAMVLFGALTLLDRPDSTVTSIIFAVGLLVALPYQAWLMREAWLKLGELE